MNAARTKSAVAVAGTLLAAAVFLAVAGGSAPAITIEPETLQAGSDVDFAPKALHKVRFTPGRLWFGTRYDTLDGSRPPALKELLLEMDRNTKFDVSGLPACSIRPGQPQPPRRIAEKECEEATLGRGRIQGEILFEESSGIDINSPLTIYKGRMQKGIPTFFGRADIDTPLPTAVFLPIRIEPIHSGLFRTAIIISIPEIAGGRGSIGGLSMRLGKRFLDHGRHASFISLRCFDGRLAVRASMRFRDGKLLRGKVERPCTVR